MMPRATEPELHIGQSIGDGHCVALVRYAADMDHTSAWRRGTKVLGGNVPRNTVIATFGVDGRYENRADGASHAAIFLEETPRHSIRVIDQWVGKVASERVIRDKHGEGPAADDASRYFIVEVA
jgi:hypothetical protein